MANPIRYAVVGLGHFAQTYVLPAFKNLSNSQLAALVSADTDKLATLGSLHGVDHVVGYDELERLFKDGWVDAAYVTTPNQLHAGIAERVACAGGHVLVETPFAVSAEEGENIARVCAAMGRRLMVAYRLHFEPANLAAIETIRSGDLGDVRSFNSVHCMQVRAPSSRTDPLLGGGPLHDLGVYCINAARYVFGNEPTEVFAFADKAPEDSRFDGIEAAVSALLRFPEGRLASFTVAYDAVAVDRYEVIGSRGRLIAEPAFGLDDARSLRIVIGEAVRQSSFAPCDQVAAVIEHFSDCIRVGVEPAAGADEGLADLRILDGLFRSLREGRAVDLERVHAPRRPDPGDGRVIAPAQRPPLVHVEAPAR